MCSQLVVSPYELGDLLLIRAVTNLHPGVGRTGEIVDLPVQKDNLGFPIIYSSSIKGALKSAFWQLPNVDKDVVKALFGPEQEDNEKFTSAVAIPDAFVVAFPVRSLEGVYAFATSPLLLNRFKEYSQMVDKEYEKKYKCVSELLKISIGKGKCHISSKAEETLKLNVESLKDKLIINEEITVDGNTERSKEIEELERLLRIEEGRLILLSDNDAIEAIERSLVRVTRIALDREKKVVKGTALWTEEYVPWGTIFTTVLLYSKSKQKGTKETEELKGLRENTSHVKEKVHELLKKSGYYLLVGGDETVGKGIVKLEFW